MQPVGISRLGSRGRFDVKGLAAALISVVASGCDFVGQPRQDIYTLVRVNGAPVPYTITRSRLYGDTATIAELRWTEGTLVMFVGGQLDWNLTSETLFNGQPRSDFPAHSDHHVGPYKLSGTSMTFEDFTGRVLEGGRVLSLTDQTGFADYATFEFERRP